MGRPLQMELILAAQINGKNLRLYKCFLEVQLAIITLSRNRYGLSRLAACRQQSYRRLERARQIFIGDNVP